jgi:hypothetical protein
MRLRLVVAVSLLSCATVRAFEDGSALIGRLCVSCHNGTQKMGGLSLESRDTAEKGGKSGPALSRADPSASLLMKRIDAGEMPPGNRLPSSEREVLRAWLKDGAPWTGQLTARKRPRADLSWWSLQPVKAFPGATIDSLLLTAMREKGLHGRASSRPGNVRVRICPGGRFNRLRHFRVRRSSRFC